MLEYYTPKRMNLYSDALVWDFQNAAKADPRKRLEPHVYEVSALAYRGLAINGEDQSILVSGESGAGKTETVKICLNHIAGIQHGPDHKSNSSSSSKIVKKVLDSNPLLEAFGNAKTRRNDNSSRFGKYLQLQFDTENPTKGAQSTVPVCALAGSKCETYLLEKCRVVSHEPQERTFHIFYQLLAAPDRVKTKIWQGLEGKTKDSYSYVGWCNTDSIEGMSDAARWNETLDSLSLIGIQGGQLKTLMRAICAVLQLGNISFQPDPSDDDRSLISDKRELESLADLMGVPADELLKAFTLRNMSIKGETCHVPLTAVKAKESCDAFAKEIYSKTFLWLVRIINDSTCAEQNYTSHKVEKFGMIGLLDIFGFERFENNGFEQLCINYANEKLQQKFNSDMFEGVQSEYELEGVPLDEIKYDDNAHVVNLIEGRMGLLDFLNEECYRPQGSDEAFVQKAVHHNKKSPCLIKPKHSRRVDFGIYHYAGEVMYEATDFVTTNTDTLPTDLQALACKSTNIIIAKELTNDNMTNVATKVKPVLRRFSLENTNNSFMRGPSNIVAPTVWTKYKNQLCALMKNLHNTQSRYIRCIKPNEEKKPILMEHQPTVDQLRCAGVIAAITISRSAFPNRMDQKQVLERFRRMWPQDQGPTPNNESNEVRRNDCDRLLTPALKHMEQLENGRKSKAFVLGHNKVYFRGGALEYLEAERLKNADEWARQEAEEAKRMEEERKRQERIEAEAQERARRAEEETRRLDERAAKEAKERAEKAAKEERLRAEKEAEKVRLEEQRKELKRERELAKQRAIEEEVENTKRKAAAAKEERRRRKAAEERKAAQEREREVEKEELQGLRNQIKEMQDRVIEAQQRQKASVDAAEERGAKELEELKAALEEERGDLDSTRGGHLNAAQESRINESGKIVAYLQRENEKLQAAHQKAMDDVNKLKDNQERLNEANEKARGAFQSMNHNAQQQNEVHTKLRDNEQTYKKQVHVLKDELKRRHKFVLAESEMRLIFQKGLAKLVEMIVEQCRQSELVEDVSSLALETEMEAKAKLSGVGLKLDTPCADEKDSNGSVPGSEETEVSDESDGGMCFDDSCNDDSGFFSRGKASGPLYK